jgi:hypothetical protein
MNSVIAISSKKLKEKIERAKGGCSECPERRGSLNQGCHSTRVFSFYRIEG